MESTLQTKRPAIFALGFRPFYLVAAVFAVLALPLWLATYFGALRLDGGLVGVHWHSHEMVFGFATAVIAGFLLTAVRNWTDRPTPTGLLLALMVAAWVVARLFAVTGPAGVAAAADLAFLPLLGIAIAVPIWRSRNLRNVKLLLVLLALASANAVFHMAYLDVIAAGWLRVSTTAALDLLTILMAIIGGRVIPVFTASAVPGASPQRVGGVEGAAIGALVGILILGIADVWFTVSDAVWVALFFTAAAAHAVRWLLWKPHQTLGNSLLWMLPMAYAWIPVSLALRGLAVAGFSPDVAATHALTLGAVGGLMLAMMMRSALGHTGRPLQAGPAEVAAFVLVQLAATVRLAGLFVDPAFYRAAVILSGVLWSLAFAVFLFRYGPMLVRPRIDGKPG